MFWTASDTFARSVDAGQVWLQVMLGALSVESANERLESREDGTNA